MNSATPFLALTMSLCLGCPAERELEPAESKYPGTLGAPCETAADCAQGLCTAQLSDEDGYLKFCYLPCGVADACPSESFCTNSGFSSAETPPGKDLRMCMRRCTDAAFCEALHPETNECSTWTANPDPPSSSDTFCGIGG